MTRVRDLALFLTLGGMATAAAAEPAWEPPYRFVVAQSLAQEGDYAEALELFRQLVADVPDESYVRIEYAELLFRVGRYAAAAEQAEAARRLAPHDPEALRLYAQVQVRLSDDDPAALERARAAFEELRELSPEELEGSVTLGQIYLSQERPGDAADLFLELMQRRPGDRMLVSMLLEALERSDRFDEAEAELGSFLDVDPAFVKARLALAEILARRGDHAGAVETLRAGLAEGEESDPEVARQLAIELYRTGRSEEALAAAETALLTSPEDFALQYLRSMALVDLERFSQALAGIERLGEANPTNLDVAVLRARLLERLGRRTEAARLLQITIARLTAAQRGAMARQARMELAELHFRGGDWEDVVRITQVLLTEADPGTRVESALLASEALVKLERVAEALAMLRSTGDGLEEADARLAAKEAEILLRTEHEEEGYQRLAGLVAGDDVEDLLLAAEVYQRLERFDDAIPVLERAKRRDPRSLPLLFRLGAVYERNGQRPEAEQEFRALLDLDPEFAPALNYLGYMWAEHGENLPEALDLVLRAVALDPDNGAYVDSLGWAYFKMGRYQEARGHLERAAELEPEDAVVHEHLGDVYRALAQTDDARQLYERALSLAGDNAEQLRRKLRELAGNL